MPVAHGRKQTRGRLGEQQRGSTGLSYGIRVSDNSTLAHCVLNCVLTGTGAMVEPRSTGAGNCVGGPKNRVPATWEGAFPRRYCPVDPVVAGSSPVRLVQKVPSLAGRVYRQYPDLPECSVR
jgi:hypothetical protein